MEKWTAYNCSASKGNWTAISIEIGGSHAQRDLFEQVYLDALLRLGTEASLAGAQGILQRQLNGQPESLRLRRQAAAVYTRLGLPAFN